MPSDDLTSATTRVLLVQVVVLAGLWFLQQVFL
jgi:hypothetical protein